MIESWQIQLPEDLELIRQKIRNLPVDKRTNLYAVLQYDEDECTNVPKMHAWINNETIRYTKELWPSVSGITRSNKVWFIKEWNRIPVYIKK